MFIHEVVGTDTSSGLSDVSVSGTADRPGRVAVRLLVGGEARTTTIDVDGEDGWTVRFGEVDCAALPDLACGADVSVEAVLVPSDEDDAPSPVQWQGRLACESPRRSRHRRADSRADRTEADRAEADRAGGEPAGGDRIPFATADVAAVSGAGTGRLAAGARAEDTGLSVTTSSATREPPRRREQEAATWPTRRDEQGGPKGRPASEAEGDVLRRVLGELREQTQVLLDLQDRGAAPPRGRAERQDAPEDRRETVRSRGGTDGDRSRDRDRDAADGGALQEVLEDMRDHLRDLSHSDDTDAADPEAGSDGGDRLGGGDEAPADRSDDPSVQQMVAEVRGYVRSLRSETDKPDQDDDADRDDDESAVEEELRRLRGQIADLGPDDDADGDAEDDDASDVGEELRRLREQIARLTEDDEESDPEGRRSEGRRRDAAASAPPRRRETRDDRDRTAAREDRRDDSEHGVLRDRWTSGLTDRSGVEDRGTRAESSRRSSRDGRERGRDRGVAIRFEPVEEGDWTDDGARCVTVRARVEHAGREAVEARLVDERDGTVLAEDRGDRGRLVLEADVEVTPGERTFTVEVEEPPGIGDVSTTYALSEAGDDRPEADQADESSESDEDEGMSGFDYVVAAGWALLCAVFLLSVAAGTGGFVQGIVTGTFLAAFGAYLTLAPSRRWGLWTLIGLGVGALATAVLLPFTPLVEMDGFLMAAGIAAAGLGAAGVVGLLHGDD